MEDVGQSARPRAPGVAARRPAQPPSPARGQLAGLIARKEKLKQLPDWRYLLIPLLPGAGLLCMLVMLGDDLGTTFVLLVIFLALLWVVGTPIRLYAGILGMIGLVLLILIVVAGYRSQRLSM